MILEKDFLYRVPVKTAPITTPGGLIRNPEILVDIEGGEFMHGNILDANSTNKLINQSVDDKITEGGYVTKNLLDAETARATAKENEIKALVDIINGDSTTEGSFRKAIADVVAAAPEDLDTLKEIADKLAGNDDLHTALNLAITEKADASALLNEVTRATGAESGLQAAIEGKLDKGNYVTYNSKDDDGYYFDKFFTLNDGQLAVSDGTEAKTTITGLGVQINSISDNQFVTIRAELASFVSDGKGVSYGSNGINSSKYPSCIPTTDGTFKPLSDFALTTDLHNVIRANNVVGKFYELDNGLKIGSEAEGFLTMSNSTISSSVNGRGFVLNWHGLTFEGRRENNEVPTTDGGFISLNNYVLKSEYNKKITALEARIAALEAKHQEAA